MNLLLGGGIIAGAMAVWGYVLNFFARLRSICIVKRFVSDDLRYALLAYLLEEYKHLKINDKRYNCTNVYIKSLNRCRNVPCVEPNCNSIFMKKWWQYLFLSGSQESTGSGGGNSGNTINILFIRGTVDFEALLIKAYDIWVENEIGSTASRFCVRQKIGSLGSSLDQSAERDVIAKSYSISKNDIRKFKVLGYEKSDIGFVEKEQTDGVDALAFQSDVLKAIRDIERWLSAKDWYKDKKIAWKRGWLLHGPPGTGKTSLVRAIGQKFGLPIYSFMLSTFTDYDFICAWNDIVSKTPCIALLEDIDTAFSGRTNVLDSKVMSGKPLCFNTLLNCIDGVDYSDGIFTVITTNMPEMLDPALGCIEMVDGVEKHIVRPGRIDRIIKLDILDETCRTKIAERILSNCSNQIQSAVDAGVGETGAQFQERCVQIALSDYWDKIKDNVIDTSNVNQNVEELHPEEPMYDECIDEAVPCSNVKMSWGRSH